MDIGMLWFDNDPKRDMTVKIQEAAEFYTKKYGQAPNVCFVHPSMIPGDSLQAGKIQVRPTRSVMPHHFWIGISNTITQN
jgi:hypothetical protein